MVVEVPVKVGVEKEVEVGGGKLHSVLGQSVLTAVSLLSF